MSGLLKLVRAKRNPPALPTTSFKNKTVLITGSNTGLGLAAAQHFLRLHATHIILAVRSLQKGEAAKDQLEQEFGKKGAVSVMHLDMNSFDSVKEFAEKVSEWSYGRRNLSSCLFFCIVLSEDQYLASNKFINQVKLAAFLNMKLSRNEESSAGNASLSNSSSLSSVLTIIPSLLFSPIHLYISTFSSPHERNHRSLT